MSLLSQAHALAGEMSRLRREIHQHPELGFREFRTAALVAETLAEIGYTDIRTQVGRTGVVAEIGRADGPVLAIRADMDALPIVEQTAVPFASQNAGIMHACGHDAHTAILLGVAHLLRQQFTAAGEQWHGRVRLLFQPSEEQWGEDGISGATAMVQDGALAGVAAVIALHVAAERPSGVCYFREGYATAAGDIFELWVRGTGGHGAYPHEGTDPLFMLAELLPQLYAIPSRRINPLDPCVVSLGSIQSGSADNVIPHEVYINGTTRAFSETVRQQLWQEIETAAKTVETLGGSYQLKIGKGYDALYNDPQVNGWLQNSAAELGLEVVVVPHPFGMIGEDFTYMAQAAPGAMFMLGAANGGGGHHTPLFDIDEAVLPLGAAVLAQTALKFVTHN